MPFPDFDGPQPGLIDRISPSSANELLACELRAAFSRDARFKTWRKPSTSSILGEAAHAVTEAAFKRKDWSEDPNQRTAQLDAAWDGFIATGIAKLKTAWDPATPPPAEEWAGYQLTKARTLRRANRTISGAPVIRGAPAPGTGIEVTLEDPGSMLFGRVDRIDRVGSTVRVVDLKTGLKQGEATEGQIRQLLLYAILVHRTSGEWPAEIAIEDASGAQTVTPLDPREAEIALEQVTSAVASFNERASAPTPSHTSQPDPDTCRWCAYRVVCRPYWVALRADWKHRSVLGEVLGSGTSNRGAHVELRVTSPSDGAGTVAQLTALAEAPADAASWIAAVDLQSGVDTAEMRAKWSSSVRIW
jgi:hypothetical protein